MVTITAAVCTYNRSSLLRDVLGSLVAQSLPRSNYEILVVDNAADPTTEALITRYFPNVRYVAEPELGLSAARNRAARCARGDIVAFIDDDAVASEEWLERVLSAFNEEGAFAACVGGKVDLRYEVPPPPWLSTELSIFLSALDLGDVRKEVNESCWLIGTNIAFRRDALLELGGFSTRLSRRGNCLLSREETVMQQRLVAHGYTCVYEPRARVLHPAPAERLTRNFLMRRLFWEGVSNAIADTESGHYSLSERLRSACVEMGRLLSSPRVLLQAAIPSWNPARFTEQCWSLQRIGYVAGLLGAGG
jgi:glycosyltransferase involved in cell wall biosynthesis